MTEQPGLVRGARLMSGVTLSATWSEKASAALPFQTPWSRRSNSLAVVPSSPASRPMVRDRNLVLCA